MSDQGAAARIRVLYIVSTLGRSGPTRQLLNLLKFLDSAAFEPHVVTLSPEPADSLIEEASAPGISLHRLDMSRLTGALRASWAVKRLVRRLEPDVVHTQGIRGDVIASGLRGVPRMATVRNYPRVDYPLTYGPVLGRAMAFAHARALRRIDRVVAVSEAVKTDLTATHRLPDITVVRNGVDTDRFHPVGPEEKRKLRHRLGLPVEAQIWIGVGHLSARKDPLTVIRAWKRVDRPGAHLVMLGDGDLRARCEAEAAGAPNIAFVGRVANVSDFLQAADSFVSASLGEGFPNAVLEAAACGLPLVLSDIAPHREIGDAVPDTCGLFAAGSVDAAVGAMASVSDRLSEDRRHPTAAADWLRADAMAAAYANLYRDLRAGRRPRAAT